MQEYKPFKEGKVRQVFDIGENLVIYATDRISAFDYILKNTITNKGVVLTKCPSSGLILQRTSCQTT